MLLDFLRNLNIMNIVRISFGNRLLKNKMKIFIVIIIIFIIIILLIFLIFFEFFYNYF